MVTAEEPWMQTPLRGDVGFQSQRSYGWYGSYIPIKKKLIQLICYTWYVLPRGEMGDLFFSYL